MSDFEKWFWKDGYLIPVRIPAPSGKELMQEGWNARGVEVAEKLECGHPVVCERSWLEDTIGGWRKRYSECSWCAEVAKIKAELEILKGELKAAEDGSGITNLQAQHDTQMKAIEAALATKEQP